MPLSNIDLFVLLFAILLHQILKIRILWMQNNLAPVIIQNTGRTVWQNIPQPIFRGVIHPILHKDFLLIIFNFHSLNFTTGRVIFPLLILIWRKIRLLLCFLLILLLNYLQVPGRKCKSRDRHVSRYEIFFLKEVMHLNHIKCQPFVRIQNKYLLN